MIKDLVVYGSITLCNEATQSNIGTNAANGGGYFIAYTSNTYGNCFEGQIEAEQLSTYEDTLLCHSNLYVCGNIFTLGRVYMRGLDIGSVMYSSNIVVQYATFSNTVDMLGDLRVGGNTSFSSNVSIAGNLTVGNATILQDNLSVAGSTTLSNDLSVGGSTTLKNTVVYGQFDVVGNSSFTNNVSVGGSVYIAGNAKTSGSLEIEGQVNACTGVTTPYVKYADPACGSIKEYWVEKLEITEQGVCADLVFESVNGTRMTFTDDFHPEVLNFTGKHRCLYRCEESTDQDDDDLLGKVVVSTGEYMSLDGEEKIQIDEAVPVVSLASKANDKRVFGVIGGFEDAGDFHIGNITFHTKKYKTGKRRAVIQSVGEGCVWVCDVNGPIENGDFLTSSPIQGYAMKQSDDILRNITIAKSTCDCNFQSNNVLKKKSIIKDGKVIECALIGVTYKM
jgi:hypothetical protein